MSMDPGPLSGDVAPISTKDRRALRRLLLKAGLIFVAVAVVTMGTVAVVNYRMDGLTFSGGQQAEAAAALESGKGIALPHANIDFRDLRREHFLLMKETPDIVIFGGSRWQEATNAAVPGKRLYNAFVSNDHFEDMMALTELLYSAGRLPKTLVLSVRFSTFEYLDRRHAFWWKSFGPEYRAMGERLGVETHSWWSTLNTGKWMHLLSARAAFEKLTADYETGWRVTDKLSDPLMDIIGPDGALRFSEQHLETYTPDFAEKDARTRAEADRKKRAKIDPTLMKQLRDLLIFVKKQGIRIALIQTPFHPVYYSTLKGSAYFDDLMDIEKQITAIAQETGAEVHGSFDAVKEGCDRNDYRDFNHTRVECLSKLLAQLKL
jgi:hypothetical protein